MTAELAAVREALAQAHEEIRGLRSYRAAAAALGQVGTPNLRPTKKAGYPADAVRRLLDDIAKYAKTGPEEVLHLLAFHTLT